MFSKVFKVEKKHRELASQPRPASANEQKPTYYPLVQSSLQDQRKRVTIHDPRAAESLEQDLDLLELVCRSDSLHKRLDELQAKYERMDDGMENISRETQMKELKSDKRSRPMSGLFSSVRTKSFEDHEAKKPGFFQRIFGNRLSKSEDDLIDKRSSTSSRIEVKESEDIRANGSPLPPILKNRRSASEDILTPTGLQIRRPDKRHSCSVEFADLVDSEDRVIPPPPAGMMCPKHKKGGLKRKRVIKMYNLNPLDKKDSDMGSTDSCYDSTDSELDNRARCPVDHGFNHNYANYNYDIAEGHGNEQSHNEVERPCVRFDLVNGGCRNDPHSLPSQHPEHLPLCEDQGRFQEELQGMPHSYERPPVTPWIGGMANVMCGSVGDLGQWEESEQRGEVVMRKKDGCTEDMRKEKSQKSHQVNPKKEVKEAMIRKCSSKRSDPGGIIDATDAVPKSRETHLHRDVGESPQDSERSDMSAATTPSSSNTQEMPTKLPTSASIKELDHFLSAIIHNLEAQLQSGGSLALKPKGSGGVEGGVLGPGEVAKRRRKKRRDENEDALAGGGERTPGKRRMSECGACGRRWVEPRLLPCLHTVCTPCLHARATHITPADTSTPISTTTTLAAQPLPKASPSPQAFSDPPGSRGASTERVLLPGCSSSTVHSNPLPTHSHAPTTSSVVHTQHTKHTRIPSTGSTKFPPSITSQNSATNTSPSRTATPTASLSNNSPSRHWNGDTASTQALPASIDIAKDDISATSSSSQNINANRTSQHQHLQNGNGIASHPALTEGQHRDRKNEDKQKGANDDLDSVIELLTNLSPNSSSSSSSNNNNNSNQVPTLTVTPTPNLNLMEAQRNALPVYSMEEEPVAVSSSSTMDSRSSSRTRSSGSCESIPKNRGGLWVVWCPECGYEAQVPPGGVECFPLNYVLQKQLVLEALNSSSTTVFCDLCHDDVVAEERCNTCPVNLCRLCSHAHTRQRRTAHHTVISLQEARDQGIREVAHTLVCATHGEGEVGWWCRDCTEPLCAACLATLHRGHQTVTVDQEAPQARRNLTVMLEQASSRMSDLLATVENLTGAASNVQQRGRTVSDQVNAFIDDYIMALEEHRHTLLRQVRQACERAQRGIVTESQHAGQTASWLRQGCDLTHDLLHHAGDAEALALAPLVTLRLQTLLREQVRGWARWERLALLREHRAGRVRGHRIQGVIADTPADPLSSRLKALCDVNNLIVGSRSSALLVARDVDGQPITHGGEEVTALIFKRDGTSLCGCSVRDREDGSYEIIFSPPIPTAAVLNVTIQGSHVQGSPLELNILSATQSVVSVGSAENTKDGTLVLPGRRHTGTFHCCTFCSSGGDKSATCACGATMPGGYQGCGHNHAGHPGQKHWSCCAQTNPSASCTRPPSQYYQVTL